MELYKLTCRVFNKDNKLIGYDAVDKNNSTFILPLNTAINLALTNSIKDVTCSSKNHRVALHGINGNDLRKLPRRMEQVAKNNDSISILCGQNAIKYAQEMTSKIRHKRDCITQVREYIKNPNNKVCTIYGLRRTGKTILMLQSLLELKSNNVAYITFTRKVNAVDLKSLMDKLVENNIKYVYIDEITEMNNLLACASMLSDVYVGLGLRVIISGTNSYMLNIASKDVLYDRTVRISTSYISYKEYRKLLGDDIGILDYIRFGGVLAANTFYDRDSTKTYIRTAITDNIVHSLENTDPREYTSLTELNNQSLFRKALEQTIDNANRELTLDVITRNYENHDIGSAEQLIGKGHLVNRDEVIQILKDKLKIKDVSNGKVSQDCINELENFLEELDVIRFYTRYQEKRKHGVSTLNSIKVPLFLQSGLRYRQTLTLIESLGEADSFGALKLSDRQLLLNKLIEDIEDQLLEQTVIIEYLIKYKDTPVMVTQLLRNGQEIDMLLFNKDTKEIVLFEIKRSSKQVDRQCKYLVNKEFNRYIEEQFGGNITGRIVLYTGKDCNVSIEGLDVYYKNIDKYLRR